MTDLSRHDMARVRAWAKMTGETEFDGHKFMAWLQRMIAIAADDPAESCAEWSSVSGVAYITKHRDFDEFVDRHAEANPYRPDEAEIIERMHQS